MVFSPRHRPLLDCARRFCSLVAVSQVSLFVSNVLDYRSNSAKKKADLQIGVISFYQSSEMKHRQKQHIAIATPAP